MTDTTAPPTGRTLTYCGALVYRCTNCSNSVAKALVKRTSGCPKCPGAAVYKDECRNRVGAKSLRCWRHGGRAPQVTAKVARKLQAEKDLRKTITQVQDELRQLGGEPHRRSQQGLPRPLNPTTLYRAYDASSRLLYVGITWFLPQRLKEHTDNSAWFAEAVRIDLTQYPDRTSALAAETEAIRTERPRYNVVGAIHEVVRSG